jgi:hypothetical protein
MSDTAKVCQVDEDDRLVFDADEAEDLGLDDDGFLSLEKSWQGLQTMITSVTAVDLFAQESLDASEVVSLAKVLKPLTWKNAVETCEAPEDEELDDMKPSYVAFRTLVLSAAEEGHGLRCEFH